MSKNPESRHSTALQFARDLQAIEQDLHLKVTPIVVPTEVGSVRTSDVDIGHFVGQKVQVIPGIVDTRTLITFRAF